MRSNFFEILAEVEVNGKANKESLIDNIAKLVHDKMKRRKALKQNRVENNA